MCLRRILKISAKLLRMRDEKFPDRRFKDDDGKEISYGDIANQIDAMLYYMFENDNSIIATTQKDGSVVIRRKTK